MKRQEELLTGAGRGGGGGRAAGSSATGDRRQVAVSLTADADDTGSGSLMELDTCSHPWKFTT